MFYWLTITSVLYLLLSISKSYYKPIPIGWGDSENRGHISDVISDLKRSDSISPMRRVMDRRRLFEKPSVLKHKTEFTILCQILLSRIQES